MILLKMKYRYFVKFQLHNDFKLQRFYFSHSPPTIGLPPKKKKVRGYADEDPAQELKVPRFRPEFPPGLRLPSDKTLSDSENYLTPGK